MSKEMGSRVLAFVAGVVAVLLILAMYDHYQWSQVTKGMGSVASGDPFAAGVPVKYDPKLTPPAGWTIFKGGEGIVAQPLWFVPPGYDLNLLPKVPF